jgi:hypothetical protein
MFRRQQQPAPFSPVVTPDEVTLTKNSDTVSEFSSRVTGPDPTPPGVPEDYLSAAALAARLGCRRAGRPTSARVVRSWMTLGVRGARLRCVEEVGVRMTRWAWYEEFRAAVAGAKAEAKRRPLEAVRVARGAQERHERAKRRLAEMDARAGAGRNGRAGA